MRLYNLQATDGPFTDAGSNGVTLTPNGAGDPRRAPTAHARAVTFTGGNFSGTDAGLPAGLAARSYGCWFKTTTTHGWPGQVGNRTPGTPFTTPSRTGLFSNNGADPIVGPYVADGQWHQAVVVEDNAAGDGVRRKLYLDGRLVGGSTVMVAVTSWRGQQVPDRRRPGRRAPFTGQIDGAFVTGNALTPDIAKLYAKSARDLGPSPKNAGDHVERLDATTDVYAIFDNLESQHTVDLSVVS